jgi:hypothetical protein
MQASAVAMSLMKFAFGELKRRSTHSVLDRQRGGGGKAVAARGAAELAAPDLDDLVRVLQRTENHVLATRILYGSKHNGPSKAQVHVTDFAQSIVFCSNWGVVSFCYSFRH